MSRASSTRSCHRARSSITGSPTIPTRPPSESGRFDVSTCASLMGAVTARTSAAVATPCESLARAAVRASIGSAESLDPLTATAATSRA